MITYRAPKRNIEAPQEDLAHQELKTLIEKDLKNKKIRDAVEFHLKNSPLQPINRNTLHKIAHLVEAPTHNPLKEGGLTKIAENVAEEQGYETLLKLSEKHRSETKQKIYAVINICALYRKDKTGKITESEKNYLRGGIPIKRDKGETDTIITLTHGGALFSKTFKKMMGALYKPLKLQDKNKGEANNRKLKEAIFNLENAARLHKKAEIDINSQTIQTN